MQITSRQTIGRHAHGTLGLPGCRTSVQSPYFQLKRFPDTSRRLTGVRPGRVIPSISLMVKVFVSYITDGPEPGTADFFCIYRSPSEPESISFRVSVPCDENTVMADLVAAFPAALDAYLIEAEYPAVDVVEWLIPKSVNPLPRSESALSLTVQTSTGAVGTQVSADQDALVMVDLSAATTAAIAGNAAVDLVLEVAPTNSATAGDWVIKGRAGNAQALSLALVLQSIQTVKGQTIAYVPKGYYVKVRSTGASGTVSTSVVEARKLLLA